MKINKIKLINFRNYENTELSFGSSKNILLGENAQGKTNLIEAIYLCAFSKSFRTNNAADMIRFGEENCNVIVEAEREGIDTKINININNSGKKIIKKDGKVLKRTAELLNNVVVVVFSPEDLRIIKDSPDKRRSFIDREMSQIKPKYHESLKRYNETLKQKNSILKERNIKPDINLLEVFDEQLSLYGSQIVKYRKNFVEMLSDRAGEIHNNISGGKEELLIKYDISIDDEEFYNSLIDSRERDFYFGYSNVGPHRDDLSLYINGQDAKKYGSQGQQRTAALSLKLAEMKIAKDIIGENPIMLLDDVLSELDRDRQSYLINNIEDSQIFITTTEINELLIDKLSNISVFNVYNGSISEKGKNLTNKGIF